MSHIIPSQMRTENRSGSRCRKGVNVKKLYASMTSAIARPGPLPIPPSAVTPQVENSLVDMGSQTQSRRQTANPGSGERAGDQDEIEPGGILHRGGDHQRYAEG